MSGRAVPLTDVPCDPRSVVTVGTFDGVHAGHQALLRYLVSRAHTLGGRSTVVTFDPHPREVVHGDRVPLLSTVDERATLMEGLGIDLVAVVDFTPAFARLSAPEFVRDVLVNGVGMQEVVVGYDFSFGRGREGNAALLQRMGEHSGFRVNVVPAEVVDSRVVGSSVIRRALLERGDVQAAAQMLDRPYTIEGRVVEGDGRGRTIGYPTANLALHEPRKLVPRHGVYAVRVNNRDEDWIPGMMNIGTRPTFDGQDVRLEVHLLDFDGDLYGAHLVVEFVERMRDEVRFATVDELVEQLSRDEERCRTILQSLS